MSGVVVVGAGAAGVSVASELRDQGYADCIRLIGDEAEQPYDRPPLSKKVLAGHWEAARAILRPADWYVEYGIELITGVTADALDVRASTVRLADGATIAYDEVVVATGLRPRRLAGYDGVRGLHTFRTLEDMRALRIAWAANDRVVVLGAGFLGMELAAVAREAGLAVTVVDPMPVPMSRGFGVTIGALIGELHTSRGVEVLTSTAVEALKVETGPHGPEVTGVVLAGGRVLAAHCVVLAIGSVANIEWLAGSGLDLAAGIVTDECLRAAPSVHAVGDVADWPSRRYGRRLRLEHRMNASDQAQVVAHNILSPGDPWTFDPIPYFWSEQFDVRVQGHGLFPAEATTVIAAGSVADGRFVAVADVNGHPAGLVGWNAAKLLMAHRPLLDTTRRPMAGVTATTARDLL